MKIAQIGPGIMQIPPVKWGAVEMLIWDYYQILTKNGHTVDIINTKDTDLIIKTVNNGNYDVAHLHYDVYSFIMPFLNAKINLLSSHYPFISQREKWLSDGYNNYIKDIVNNKNYYILASSQNDINTFINNGANPNRIFLNKLGVRSDDYTVYDRFLYDKTFCFSQIVDRKRQYLIQDIDTIDFSGRLDDGKFLPKNNYLGELERHILNLEISKYINMILLSSTENATPLVIKEALICGLGIVASEVVAQDLDKSKDFITIIPEDMIHNIDYIKYAIIKNKEIAKKCRKEIIEYGLKEFDLTNILNNQYIPLIKSLKICTLSS